MDFLPVLASSKSHLWAGVARLFFSFTIESHKKKWNKQSDSNSLFFEDALKFNEILSKTKLLEERWSRSEGQVYADEGHKGVHKFRANRLIALERPSNLPEQTFINVKFSVGVSPRSTTEASRPTSDLWHFYLFIRRLMILTVLIILSKPLNRRTWTAGTAVRSIVHISVTESVMGAEYKHTSFASVELYHSYEDRRKRSLGREWPGNARQSYGIHHWTA